MIRAYLSHPIRGAKGSAATREDMDANNRKAIEFANKLRTAISDLDLYVPAEHDEFVMLAYEYGILSEDDILAVDEKIVVLRDLLIQYIPYNYVSRGMQRERDAAIRHHVPITHAASEDDINRVRFFVEALF